ncbi:MAG TPA: hypothetical protein VGM33_11625 [Baekduia sp.]
MALAPPILQEDFAAGMFRIAPHLIPSNGAWRLQNMMLDEDGSAYARRGASYKSNVAFGATGLRMLWDGWLAGGQRTVFANAADFGVLDADDETPVNLGGSGLAGPTRPVAMDGLLFVGDAAYGGSRKAAAYSAGTIAVTQGSTAIVGTGTAWLANVDAGMVLVIGDRLHAVAAVVDNTHITLSRSFTGATATGQAYSLTPLATIPAPYNPGGTWAVVGNRLISLKGDRVAMSAEFDSTTWDPTDEWLMPEGAQLLGSAPVHDTLMVFSTAGMWALSGLDLDLTDAVGNTQQSLQRVNSDLILWGQAGIATWDDALVVPGTSGIWLVSPGQQVLLSESITPLVADYLAKGYRVGQATVFRSHYLLPVLDSGGTPVDLLVCRLDRPIEVRRFGRVFPWTNWAGAGAAVAALEVRVAAGASRQPVLLGGDRTASSRVIVYPPFQPDGPGVDEDGSEAGAPVVSEFVSRDMPAGGQMQSLNLVKRLRARYELIAPTTTAVLMAWHASEAAPNAVTWGGFVWGSARWQDEEGLGFSRLDEDAPEDPGDHPFTWPVGKRRRYFRIKLSCQDECQRFVLRAVEVTVRPSGRL